MDFPAMNAEFDDPVYIYRVDLLEKLLRKKDQFFLAKWTEGSGYPHAAYRQIAYSLPSSRRIFSISFWRTYELANTSYEQDFSTWRALGRKSYISRIKRSSAALKKAEWIDDDALPGTAYLGYVIETETASQHGQFGIPLAEFEVRIEEGRWIPLTALLSELDPPGAQVAPASPRPSPGSRSENTPQPDGPATSRLLHRWSLAGLLLLLAGAVFHRYAGFANPHQVWFREVEKHWMGYWAPGALEHLFGGFALISLMAYFSARGCGVIDPRNVSKIVIVYGVVYLIFSTLLQDASSLAAGDKAQVAQIIADILALLAAFALARHPISKN